MRSRSARSGAEGELSRFMAAGASWPSLVLPVVQRRPARGELFSHGLGTFLSAAKLDDSGLLQHIGIPGRTLLASASNRAISFSVRISFWSSLGVCAVAYKPSLALQSSSCQDHGPTAERAPTDAK